MTKVTLDELRKQKARERLRRMMERSDLTQITIRIPTPVYLKFKEMALKRRSTMTDAIYSLILKYLKNDKL